MTEYPILWEWLSFAVRWAHVIAAMGWIGASFYFIALDLGLRKPDTLPDGVRGEEWQVHGGGFYHVRKYMVAPPGMPDHLIWFKWDSYATWLTGFAMLAVVYYAGAELYLVDVAVNDISSNMATAISLASLIFGWIIYDLLCRLAAGKSDTALMILLFALLVLMAWGYTEIFTQRAAFLHLGAFTATIMTANVAMIIMPNQRKTVATLKAGREPDPKYGIQAKQRSLHNNYLTLPVIFLMLSNHYPLAFATDYNWLIASLIFLIGVCIRHYFNSYHASKGVFIWPWIAALSLFGIIIWLSTFNSLEAPENAELETTSQQAHLVSAPQFEQVQELIGYRCAMCHTAEPLWDGIAAAPKGVRFDSDHQILRHAREIYLHAASSRAMPPANITAMEDSERQLIANWYKNTLTTAN